MTLEFDIYLYAVAIFFPQLKSIKKNYACEFS